MKIQFYPLAPATHELHRYLKIVEFFQIANLEWERTNQRQRSQASSQFGKIESFLSQLPRVTFEPRNLKNSSDHEHRCISMAVQSLVTHDLQPSFLAPTSISNNGLQIRVIT